MKNKLFKITEKTISDNVHGFVFNNAHCFDDEHIKILLFVQHFVEPGKICLGFHRTDGSNLTYRKTKKHKNEIQSYFHNYCRKQTISPYLKAIETQCDEKLYLILPIIFDYYLDTVFFQSKLDFDDFVTFHSDYLNHYVYDYILNGFTEIVFSYYDSGDFCVFYDTEVYETDYVKKIINCIWNNIGEENKNKDDTSL